MFLFALIVLILWVRSYEHRLRVEDRPSPLPARLPAGDAAHVRGQKIDLVSGHLGFDSGAVCADGLAEVQVNRTVTRALGTILAAAGAQVTVLQEYDPRLEGLRADVFLSIHADSCLPLSGFKVARWEQSSHPGRDDRLVSCLRYYYWLNTGLNFDARHVTADMLQYHAFRKLDPGTPAAIVETGYLGGDRRLLTRKPQLAAMGIAQGIACFLGKEAGR